MLRGLFMGALVVAASLLSPGSALADNWSYYPGSCDHRGYPYNLTGGYECGRNSGHGHGGCYNKGCCDRGSNYQVIENTQYVHETCPPEVRRHEHHVDNTTLRVNNV